ncbi:MAG: Omp28-related outer membrane protein [Bacteroidetes bacterium]|nr:Omp28-related outer membrane protein [Bacteroidota bacterium]
MRRSLLTIVMIAVSAFYSAKAQTLVSTQVQNRNVVLEEYTGINCQYCPDGHALSQALSDANPNRVVLVNVHQGSYAIPTGGQPDYRTVFGDPLAAQAAIAGYPAGTVNRHLFPSIATGTSMGRSSWSTAASQILPQVSPLNVGVHSTFNSGSRLLTVDVELYYTGNSAAADNFITVALLENHVIGVQNILGTMNPSYDHKHMLRHFVTGQWGDTVNTTTAGSFVQRQYTYTVPAGFNVANCDVAVYVAESHQEIITGTQVVADGGTTLNIGDAVGPTTNIENKAAADTASFPFTFTSAFAGSSNFLFTLTTDAPANWNAVIGINGVNHVAPYTAGIFGASASNIAMKIIPGSTVGVAKYRLTISSVLHPEAPIKIQDFFVMSGITDLIINNEGWSSVDTNAINTFKQNFVDGLTYAGNTSFTSVSSSTFLKFANASKLGTAKNLYFNVGWTMPTLTDEMVSNLTTILTAGGRLFISGQDIGWDTWDTPTNGATGTVNTKAFYTNYLNAAFVDDGGSTNNSLTINTTDPIFGTVGTSSITNVYGGAYFYPDQIDTVGFGLPIFYYGNNTPKKISAVRAEDGTYKTVYLGMSLEMISTATVRKEILKISHDWFHNLINSVQMEEMMKQLMGQNFPNPGNDYTTIPLSDINRTMKLQILDLSGKLISEQQINAGTQNVKVNTTNMQSGMYLYRLLDGNNLINSKPMQVIH